MFLGSSNGRRALLFHVGAALLGVHICVLGSNSDLIRLDEGRFDAFWASGKLPRACIQVNIGCRSLKASAWTRHGDVKSLIFICFSELFGVSVFFELADIVEPSWSHFAVILDRPWAVRKEFSGCLACVFCYLEGFWVSLRRVW